MLRTKKNRTKKLPANKAKTDGYYKSHYYHSDASTLLASISTLQPFSSTEIRLIDRKWKCIP